MQNNTTIYIGGSFGGDILLTSGSKRKQSDIYVKDGGGTRASDIYVRGAVKSIDITMPSAHSVTDIFTANIKNKLSVAVSNVIEVGAGLMDAAAVAALYPTDIRISVGQTADAYSLISIACAAEAAEISGDASFSSAVAEMAENSVCVSAVVSVNGIKYRLLSELDNGSLSAYDSMTLDEISFITF